MPKTAVFTMKIDADLRADFMAAAEASHRPASQVARELMRDFVERQKEREGHAAFLYAKVEVARRSIDEGRGRANEAVEADFAARRSGRADVA